MASITVNWNNFNPPFSTEAYRSYDTTGASTTLEDVESNVVKLTWLKTGGGYGFTARVINIAKNITANHKMYCSYMIKPSKTGVEFGVEYAGGITGNGGVCPADQWTRIRFIGTSSRNGSYPVYYGNRRGGVTMNQGDYILLKSPLYIDLTQMYGAGKEPATIEEFEEQCRMNNIDLENSHEMDLGTDQTWKIFTSNILQESRKRIIGSAPHILDAASETNTIVFDSPFRAPIVSLEVFFQPIQTGSGAVSPDNIRPLQGYTSLTVDDNKGNNTVSNWGQSVGTIYHGYVDIIKGVIVEDYDTIIFKGNEAFGNLTDTTINGRYILWIDTITGHNDYNSNIAAHPVYCSHFKTDGTNTTTFGEARYNPVSGSPPRTYFSPMDPYGNRWGSKSAFLTWVTEQYNNNNPITALFPLKTTQHTYQITPQPIMAARGTNRLTIQNATGIRIKYWGYNY